MKTNLFKKRTGISSLLLVGLLVVSTEFFAQTDTYTVAGTQTWTCPAGVSSVSVQCWGGGGGSGGASNILNSAGGGGGGGAYAYSVINVTPGTTYTINVGAGVTIKLIV